MNMNIYIFIQLTSQQTYCFVSNNTDGQRAANGQLTGPGHWSPLDTLEHTQLLNCIPTAGVKHMESQLI